MKSLGKTTIVVAVLIVIIGQAKPFILETMNTLFSRYEALANAIVVTDEQGNITLNGEPAEVLLNDLGEGAEEISNTLTQQAEEVLNVENTEDVEEMQNTVNDFFEWFTGVISPLMGKE